MCGIRSKLLLRTRKKTSSNATRKRKGRLELDADAYAADGRKKKNCCRQLLGTRPLTEQTTTASSIVCLEAAGKNFPFTTEPLRILPTEGRNERTAVKNESEFRQQLEREQHPFGDDVTAPIDP